KCLLAQLPEDVARLALGEEPYERRTEHTITTWKRLAKDLAATRDSGVVVSEEEYEIGLASIAAPVRWVEGPGSGAINVSLPASRATPKFRQQLTRGLLEAAAAIDAEMSTPPRRR